ncbi:pyridoxamine 5'-phosphate oxidase family protein [Protaetiibacter mangrovi]|uniref:Pyridoxamine 5'-phosphate oxidase family protein n=1 Tax=Protaetiibacter mangrovi TaxID=2970926 RepID=A0ABT1ZHL0_9MICO|nr:pyridoxamine 5'-phosphate oxidase family protein [Protaetiibacter mangrovi]MCS0500191.1 pyridoxamine 5'-phosphate oxidase family protein [Protaetiibacter mangrovi]TPX05100.1 pyridoxamine 5'-phosphate oxidase family protein [Schumannella luteola]
MEHGAEVLDEAACWRLLAEAEVGRVVFVEGDDIEVFPVNFAVGGRSVLFRSAPGSKLELVAEHPQVAFEVDRHDDEMAWSVILWGVAERLAFDDEIEHSGILGLVSWSPDEKFNYVRITPDRMSGRRFRRADVD